jgi:hypothetical protein
MLEDRTWCSLIRVNQDQTTQLLFMICFHLRQMAHLHCVRDIYTGLNEKLLMHHHSCIINDMLLYNETTSQHGKVIDWE